MYYGPTGAFEAARRMEEPTAVEQHRRWRDIALEFSIRLSDYDPAHQPA
jgi:hypothetical protein